MDKINKERIMKMIKDNTLCICPFCKGEVYPRYRDYFLIGRSGLFGVLNVSEERLVCFGGRFR